jgi:hypothetical protein
MTSIRDPSFSSTSTNSDFYTDVGAGRLRARKYIFVVGGMQNLEDYQGPGSSAEVHIIITFGYVAIATRFYSSIRIPIRCTIRAPASRRGALSCC